MKGLAINTMGGLELNEDGRRVVERGGEDGVSDDEILMLEIAKRAPGMSAEDMQGTFIALLVQYGEDALRAVRTGHVQFHKNDSAENPDG